MQVNLGEAKARLADLVERAAAGEEILIAWAGKPVAVLAPYPKPRRPGGWKGRAEIDPGFDERDKEIEALFYGEHESDEG